MFFFQSVLEKPTVLKNKSSVRSRVGWFVEDLGSNMLKMHVDGVWCWLDQNGVVFRDVMMEFWLDNILDLRVY